MKKYILLISAIISIGLTSYFSLLPLNGVSQVDMSDLYSTPITPAGFTFSIWSLIYASWLGLGIYALRKKTKIKKALRCKLAIAQVLSMIWLIPWHYDYIFMSLVVMITILVILWQLMGQIKGKDRWFGYVVSLFFGWIAIAFLLNANVALIAHDLYLFPTLISGLSLAIGTNISLYWIVRKQNYIPACVLIWAVIGILMK